MHFLVFEYDILLVGIDIVLRIHNDINFEYQHSENIFIVIFFTIIVFYKFIILYYTY